MSSTRVESGPEQLDVPEGGDIAVTSARGPDGRGTVLVRIVFADHEAAIALAPETAEEFAANVMVAARKARG